MPLSHSQMTECLREVGAFVEKRRPPARVRDKVDLHVNITGSQLTIVHHRRAPNGWRDEPIARARWIASRQVWRLFWMRADLKWHSYLPMPEARTISAVLSEIDRDSHCCFFG